MTTVRRSQTAADIAERYAAALLDPDLQPSLANAVIDEALEAGTAATTLAVDVIPAALAEVGRRWQAGEVSVAEEHLATETVRGALRLLSERRAAKAPRHGRVIVAAVDGELHDLGSRVVADLLAADGWEVLYVGAATPTDALAALVRDRKPDAVALSATLSTRLPAVEAAVARLRAPGMPRTFVLVGGRACADEPELARRVGADACELRADDAVRLLSGVR